LKIALTVSNLPKIVFRTSQVNSLFNRYPTIYQQSMGITCGFYLSSNTYTVFIQKTDILIIFADNFTIINIA